MTQKEFKDTLNLLGPLLILLALVGGFAHLAKKGEPFTPDARDYAVKCEEAGGTVWSKSGERICVQLIDISTED